MDPKSNLGHFMKIFTLTKINIVPSTGPIQHGWGVPADQSLRFHLWAISQKRHQSILLKTHHRRIHATIEGLVRGKNQNPG